MSTPRSTRQREAVWKALREGTRPLGPEEILERARRDVPRLGIATVYRCLNLLVDQGRATPVEIPNQPRRFERAGLGHHHHFCCTSCSRVYELEGCALREPQPVPDGFEVDSHDIILYGTCADCH